MEREAVGPNAEGASLDDHMARIGQFAAAKRSIQATFDAKAREMQAQEATLGIISTRKAERDRVRAEREAAARTKQVAEEQLEKLHLEGVAEVEAVHRLLAEFLEGGSASDPVEMATSAHLRLTRSLQFLAPASYDGAMGLRSAADQATKEQIAQLRQEVRAAEAQERRLHEQETELVLEEEESPENPTGQGLAPAPAGAGGGARHGHGDDDLARIIAEKDEQIQKLIQQVAGMQIQIEKAHCANIKIGELVFQQDQDSQLRALQMVLDSHLSGHHDDANGALAEEKGGGDQGMDSGHSRGCADAEEDEERGEGEESDPRTVMDGDMVVVADGAQVLAEAARDLSSEREREAERRKARVNDAEEELSFQDILDVGQSLASTAVDEGSKVMAKVMRAASPARWRPLEGVLNFAGIRGLSPARSRPPTTTPAESNKASLSTKDAPEGGDSKGNSINREPAERGSKPPGMPKMTAMLDPPLEMASRRGASSSKYALGGSRGMPTGSKFPGMSASSFGVPNIPGSHPTEGAELETSNAKSEEPRSVADSSEI